MFFSLGPTRLLVVCRRVREPGRGRRLGQRQRRTDHCSMCALEFLPVWKDEELYRLHASHGQERRQRSMVALNESATLTFVCTEVALLFSRRLLLHNLDLSGSLFARYPLSGGNIPRSLFSVFCCCCCRGWWWTLLEDPSYTAPLFVFFGPIPSHPSSWANKI